jgi:hypothetical protein
MIIREIFRGCLGLLHKFYRGAAPQKTRVCVTTPLFFLEQNMWSQNCLAKKRGAELKKHGAEQSQTPLNKSFSIMVLKCLLVILDISLISSLESPIITRLLYI